MAGDARNWRELLVVGLSDGVHQAARWGVKSKPLRKTKVIKEYEQAFFQQCPIRGLNIDRPFRLNLDVYHQNNLPDLDNCLKVLLDCMQQCKVIKNDRLCFEISARKLIDKTDPRVEFTIEELI